MMMMMQERGERGWDKDLWKKPEKDPLDDDGQLY
jgi:hypothetical protein